MDRALVALSVGWSFSEIISPDTLASRSREDLTAVLEVLHADVIAPLEAEDTRAGAQELFAGLVEGRLPTEFFEAHIMAATGWTWEALQETPVDVVRRLAVYLAVRQAHASQETLDFQDDTDLGTQAAEEESHEQR